MAVNQHGRVYGVDQEHSTMDDYDALHPLLREISRNAELSVNDRVLAIAVKSYTLEQIRDHIAYATKESCRLEYGPDHPQAK